MLQRKMARKHHSSHKQTIVSAGINAVGLAISFNQGIVRGIGAIGAGPQEAIRQAIYGETGLDVNSGSFSWGQLGVSLGSKAVGLIWVKFAHALYRRMRVRF